MRLFIAFDVSKEVHDYFIELQKKLPESKLTLTKSFHQTLKFLGEVTPDNAEKIKQLITQVKFSSFTASLNRVGVFPENGKPRVVWIGLEPKDMICNLQKQIDDALQGLFPKEKDFHPHITLARIKDCEKSFKDQLAKIKVEHLSFEVTNFKLIESQLQSTGPVYRDLAIFQ